MTKAAVLPEPVSAGTHTGTEAEHKALGSKPNSLVRYNMLYMVTWGGFANQAGQRILS
jgi:hypothetical protein